MDRHGDVAADAGESGVLGVVMAIRIRMQTFRRGQKRSSVEIISVDQFTGLAGKLDNQYSEREHLVNLLQGPCFPDNPYKMGSAGDPYPVDSMPAYYFWVEKP
jgi:hypothetical protein